jgi:hypothetical protein
VSRFPFRKVRGSNLGPETGNVNCMRYCPKFLKPLPHPRFHIHFTAPQWTFCLLELWDRSNDAVYCHHFSVVSTLLHGRPRCRARFPLGERVYSSQLSDKSHTALCPGGSFLTVTVGPEADIPGVDVRMQGAVLPLPIRVNGLVSNDTWAALHSHWPQVKWRSSYRNILNGKS